MHTLLAMTHVACTYLAMNAIIQSSQMSCLVCFVPAPTFGGSARLAYSTTYCNNGNCVNLQAVLLT